MKFLKIMGVLFAFLLILGIVAVNIVLSIKGDIEDMQDENPAIFVVNPENGEVELGIAINKKEGGVVLVDSAQKVGDTTLRNLFQNSEKSGADMIIGSAVKGYTYTEGEIKEKSVKVDRVVLVDDIVIAEIFALAGAQKIEIGKKGDLFYAERVVDTNELLQILRGEMEGMEWEVSIYNPLLGKPVAKKITTGELLSIAEDFGIEIDKDLIKILILAQLADKAAPVLRSDEIKIEIVKIMLREYKNGNIRTYPVNTLTKAIKYIPEEQLLSLLEGME
jgi:hypothetical protein